MLDATAEPIAFALEIIEFGVDEKKRPSRKGRSEERPPTRGAGCEQPTLRDQPSEERWKGVQRVTDVGTMRFNDPSAGSPRLSDWEACYSRRTG